MLQRLWVEKTLHFYSIDPIMTTISRKEPFILVLGDIVAFYMGLWLMLFLRYAELPTKENLTLHLIPFSILFVIWLGVFFIAGLYEKHTLLIKQKVAGTILRAQITNSILAVLFFYFVPFFGIAPKTNLFLSLITSFGFVMVWRLFLFPSFEVRIKEKALLVGSGPEMLELEKEVNNNSRYDMQFVSTLDVTTTQGSVMQSEMQQKIYAENISVIVADFRDEKVEPVLPTLYNLIFSDVRFVDMYKLYEDIFDRIPLSLVRYNWFLEHISGTAERGYDFLKRAMDFIISLVLGMISLAFYPFVYIAIKLEDGGPIFFTQERIGKSNELIIVKKFRSLAVHNNPDGIAKNPLPTKVGAFLRRTRIDELPQLWSVLIGDLSLIGPRPEIPALVQMYEKEIPYYNVRHLIKPGLSGWAQLYQSNAPRWGTEVNETRVKLSYDLYYIKHRSLGLDLKVALRTIKTLLSREGI